MTDILIPLEKWPTKDFTLYGVNRKYEQYDFTPLIKSLSWGGDYEESSLRIEATLDYYPGMENLLGNGEALYLFGKNPETLVDEEICQIIVTKKGRSTNSEGDLTFYGYDLMWYLLKNKEDYYFKNTTASSIMIAVCRDFNIPIGQIDDTGYIIPKLPCRGEALYDIFRKALSQTYDNNGRKFNMRMKGGKFYCYEKKVPSMVWVLEEGVNLLEASYEESIENLRNKIKVLGNGKDNEKSPIIQIYEDTNNQQLYGLLQEIYYAPDSDNQVEALDKAKKMLQNLNKVERIADLKALGISNLFPGDPIYVKESKTGLVGGYFAGYIWNTLSDGQHQMQVKLRWDDVLSFEGG